MLLSHLDLFLFTVTLFSATSQTYSSQHLVLKHPQCVPSLGVKDQDSYSHNETGKIYYIIIISYHRFPFPCCFSS